MAPEVDAHYTPSLSMVIRVVRGHVKLGREGEFNALMREERLPEIRRQPGFVYAKFGRQIGAEGERFIFVSEWQDVGSLYDWIGPDLTKPVTIRGAEHLVDEYVVELYEALDMPLHPEGEEPIAELPRDEPIAEPARHEPR